MPTPIDVLLKRIEVLLNQERYQQAAKELYKLVATNPENTEVVSNLVRALTGASKNKEAQEWALKLLSLDPNRSYFYYLAAFVEVRLHLFDSAETHIRRAIELEPEWAMNFEVLSRIYQHRGKYEEGLKYANQGLQLDPDHIDCLDARAFSLAMLGRKEEAQLAINQALSIDPENAYLRRDIGVALTHMGDYQSAEKHLRETLRLDPAYEDAQHQLAHAIMQKHRLDNGIYRVSHWVGIIPRWFSLTKVLVIILIAAIVMGLEALKPDIAAFAILGQVMLTALVGVYIFWIVFQLVWMPFEIASDTWLTNLSADRHLFPSAKRRTYCFQLVWVCAFLLANLACMLWFGPADHRAAQCLTFTCLAFLIVYWYRRKKTT